MPDESYREIGRAPKFLNFDTFVVGLFGLLFFIGGAWLGARPFSRLQPLHAGSFGLSVREITYRQTMYLVFLVASVAYVLWLRRYLVNPSLILPILREDPGAVYAAREIAERVPGITSFTNVGPLYVLLFTLYSKATGARRKTWDKLAMGLFLFLTVVIVFIYSVRLALVSLAIPFVLATFGGAAKRWKLIALLPVVLAVLFVLFFGINEYFRSWLYADRGGSFWGFVFSRLAAYYVTASNNGALMFEKLDTLYLPFYTAQWFWKFPIELVPGGMPELFNVDMDVYSRLLGFYANPEFNNNSGLFCPFVDFGIVGGMISWAVLGWISGRLYHGFTKGTAVGLLLYPCWYTGVLEIPRYFTFGGTPFFVLFVVTLGVIWAFKRVGSGW